MNDVPFKSNYGDVQQNAHTQVEGVDEGSNDSGADERQSFLITAIRAFIVQGKVEDHY